MSQGQSQANIFGLRKISVYNISYYIKIYLSFRSDFKIKGPKKYCNMKHSSYLLFAISLLLQCRGLAMKVTLKVWHVGASLSWGLIMPERSSFANICFGSSESYMQEGSPIPHLTFAEDWSLHGNSIMALKSREHFYSLSLVYSHIALSDRPPYWGFITIIYMRFCFKE